MNKLLSIVGLLILLTSVADGASGGTISGTVKDPNGVPLEGAFVQAHNKQTKTITVSVLSGKEGRYRIANLLPGDYEVWTKAIGYRSDAPVAAKVDTDGSASLDFMLKKGMVRWEDLSNYQMSVLLPDGKGKRQLIGCGECHGIQTRFAAAHRDADGVMSCINLMRTFLPNAMGDQQAADMVSYTVGVFGEDSTLPKSPAELPKYNDVAYKFSDEAMKIVYVDYGLPHPNRAPWGAHPGKDGKVWIPYYGDNNRIGALDPNTGEVQEFQVPDPAPAMIHSVAPGPDGAVWIAEQDLNKLGKWDPKTQKITEYQAAYKPGGKHGVWKDGSTHTVVVDLSGDVWTTGWPLRRFNPETEKFTEFPEVHEAYGVTVDQQGNVWWAQLVAKDGGKGDTIGKVDTKTGKVSSYTVPTPNSGPRRIAVDSEGIVWFAEYYAGKIGRFDPKTQTFKEYELPGPDATPYGLGVDRDNNIWYNSTARNIVGRLDSKTGLVTEYPFPYSEAMMKELFSLDAQGRLWFGSAGSNRVGYFTLAGAGGGH